jgi:NitT/TauT family transport system permease protein
MTEVIARPETTALRTAALGRFVAPLVVGIVLLAAWEFGVRLLGIPKYVLPPPSAIAEALVRDASILFPSMLVTFRVTFVAFLLALACGFAAAVLFSQSRLIEAGFFPYAVALQVTPIVAIAPLILVWVGLDHVERALLIIATIIAFFPILSNTTLGLKSVDHNLHSLFDLYGASRWQRLVDLQVPSALPYLLGGMKISGGLALIGAVVAEFVAGSGIGTGLAWRVIESSNRLDMPRLFAALFLLCVLGMAIFFVLSAIEHRILRRWHESSLPREN